MSGLCKFCQKENSKYLCPKCGIPYCSLACYKSQQHINCSEKFYRECIQEEITTAQPNSKDDVSRVYDILKRIQEADAGVQPNFDGDSDQSLDSDDDRPEDEVECDDDIAARLEDVDINDADAVWEKLTADERKEFEKLVETGDIMKLLPNYIPWWTKRQAKSKITELPSLINKEETNIEDTDMPEINKNILEFSKICSKPPPACLHYNLWNMLGAYACIVRFYNGEHLTSTIEAATVFVNLSGVLKYGTNFEDAEDALLSVEMEALTTGNGNKNAAASSSKASSPLLVESREKLQEDARQLMFSKKYKLAALSDIIQLLKLAKEMTKSKSKQKTDMQKVFALSMGTLPLDTKKIQEFIRKIEFYLSFVNRIDNATLK